MSGALYTRDILRLAVSIPHQKRLDNPDGTAEKRSQTCGSRAIADVMLSSENTIEDLGLEINACALGQASAAIVGGEAIGKTAGQIEAARAQLAAFLIGADESPGDWRNMNHLEAAREHKGRHGAIMLPYDALIGALEAAQSNMEAA